MGAMTDIRPCKNQKVSFDQLRYVYRRSLTWAGALAAGAAPTQMDLSTPCRGWTVRVLLGHLVGTVERSLGTAEGRDTSSVPHVVADVADAELAVRFGELASKITLAWSRTVADQAVKAPWGICPAEHAISGFVIEALVHGWDLAVATGQPVEAPDRLAESVLERVDDVVPSGTRQRMYDAAYAPAVGAGPTERLANILGHHARMSCDLGRSPATVP